jgi:hypothetical protein
LRRGRQRGLVGSVLQFGVECDHAAIVETDPGHGDERQDRDRI